MNKSAHTYQTPSGTLTGAPELPGARWYGWLWYRGTWRIVACIDQDDTSVLVSGPDYFGWVNPHDVVPDDDGR